MKRKSLHRPGICAAIAAAFIMGGCADTPDDSKGVVIEEGTPNVAFTISTRSTGTGTRADGGQPASPTSENEKIKDWWLVFVDTKENPTVRKIVKRVDVIAAGADGKRPAVEVDTFRCIVAAGTYDIYAFANISQDELTQATRLSFTEGSPAPSDISEAVWNGLKVSDPNDAEKKDTDGRVAAESVTALGAAYDAVTNRVSNNNLNLWDTNESNGKAIPMTGHLRVKIENTIEETFSIEVVRMVAKVELQFKNPGNTPVTIKSVGISPVTVTPVALFPQYGILGQEAYNALDNALYARLKHNITEEVTVPAGSEENPGTKPYVFYMKESLSNETGSFTVWLEVAYQNGTTEILQFSPTVDIKDYINRNDWIQIPIKLSDYDVKVEAVFYPPIGGYPAINEGTDPDGSQEFTFGTQGKFAIMPYVTDKMTGTQVTNERYRIEVDEILYSPKTETGNWKNPIWENAIKIYPIDPNDPKGTGIFTKMPVSVEEGLSQALPYEILGELNEYQGIARVKLKAYIYASEDILNGRLKDNADAKHTYTRYLYIIRENPSANNNGNTDNTGNGGNNNETSSENETE